MDIYIRPIYQAKRGKKTKPMFTGLSGKLRTKTQKGTPKETRRSMGSS
jgi:hypothetical protein